MIKLTIGLFLLISANSAFAISYESIWTEDYKKNVIMTCSEDEFQCEDLCGKSSCVIKEKVCRNCIGSNIRITHIFRDMGRSFTNTGNEVSYYEVLEILGSGHFATFTSKSIYNIVERYDSAKLRKKFQSLCPNEINYPIVIFSTKKVSRILDEVKFV
ncbi:MAG: hypothetical protein ACJARO_002158, partial [Bacteriovoracaceae bacterium]